MHEAQSILKERKQEIWGQSTKEAIHGAHGHRDDGRTWAGDGEDCKKGTKNDRAPKGQRCNR